MTEVVAVEVRSKAKANLITAASLAIKQKIAGRRRRSKAQEGSHDSKMEVEKFLALEAVAAAVKEAKKQGSATSVKRLDI